MLAVGRQELLPGGGRVGAEPPADRAPEAGLAPPAGAQAQVPDTGSRAAGHRGDALAGPQQELLRAASGRSVPRAPVLPESQLDAEGNADSLACPRLLEVSAPPRHSSSQLGQPHHG